MSKITCPSCGAQFHLPSDSDCVSDKFVQNSNELSDRREPQFVKQPGIPKGILDAVEQEKKMR